MMNILHYTCLFLMNVTVIPVHDMGMDYSCVCFNLDSRW